MKNACAVTILAQGAKKGPRLSHSKQGTFDNGRHDTLAAGPLAGMTPVPPDKQVSDALMPPSPPQQQQLFAVSRGLRAKTRASPTIRMFLVLTKSGVAARIGASVVARLVNIDDIHCTERLAITNSGPQRTCVSLCYALLELTGDTIH